MYRVPYSSEAVQYKNKFFYSIYKYFPKYIYKIISTIKKTNIGGTQLLDRDPFLCDYARPIGLLSTESEQLLEMTELVPRPIFCAEVFRNHIRVATLGGLATSRECLQLDNRLPWKPQYPMLVKTYNCRLPRRLRRLIHKCTGPPFLNGGTSLPPDHSNSHPSFLCKPGSPWPIERTKRWAPCPVLMLCFPIPPSLVLLLLWVHVSLPMYVH